MTLICYLTRTHFAELAIEDALPEEIASRGIRDILALADDDAASRAACDRVREALPRVRVQTAFCQSGGPRRAFEPVLRQSFEESGAQALMAIGGPAAIGQARVFAEAAARSGVSAPIIAVPVGFFDLGLARHVRLLDGAPLVCPRPDLIIADPTVLDHAATRGLAASGMETLVHAMEAYASPGYNPPADGLALEAVRRLSRWLPSAVARAGAAEARREAMAGALSAGLAMEKTVGGVDALAHPLERDLGDVGAPGLLHAPLFAAFVDFNAPAVGERYATIAAAMGGAPRDAALASDLRSLARQLGLPGTIGGAGVDRGAFGVLARNAANDPSAIANPRRLSAKDCRQLLETAW